MKLRTENGLPLVLHDMETVEFEEVCPKCEKPITVHLGQNQCPHCRCDFVVRHIYQ